MKATLVFAILIACLGVSGCDSAANTVVTEGADAKAIEDYKAQVEAQQKAAAGIEVK